MQACTCCVWLHVYNVLFLFLRSLLYDFISQSEVFQDTPDVTPSLFTEIICPANMDCKIRVNVYYSSSLTGNKEIVLAGTTFNLMELMRYNKLFSSIMNSEHCVGAKAIIEVAPAFSCVLNQTALFPIKIPGRFDFSSPLVQHYCFFHEDDITSPLVDSQELMFEPRFSFRLPALFIQNTLDSLSLAVSAWKQRYELERMRQGRFRNDEEAFRNGWHVLRLTITGTNFFNTDGGPVKSSRGSRASNGSLAVSTNMCNESYVEAFVDNKLKTFSTPVGKTNIEHDNNAPVYGSNLHPGNRKGQDFVAAGSHVRLITEPKIYQFRTCESSDFSADQPKSLSGDVVSLHGTVNQFVMYVPDLESSCIRLNLYADFQDQNLTPLSSESEKDGTSASGLPLCGYGFVPLIEGEKISNVNIMLSESFSTYLEAEIRVKVAVESGNGSVSEGGENKEVLKRVAPSHFPATNSISAEKFKDNVVGNVDNTGTDRLKAFTKPLTTTAKAVNYDTAQVLSECYEWLWLIGYSGTDPLSFSKFNQQGEPSRLINANANVTPRVDCEYPLEWIAEHISSLEALQVELKYLLGRCVEMEAENMRFRASTKKKDREFQVLPTNLHYQMLLNRSHRRSDEGESEHSRSRNASVDENGVQRPDVIIVDSVTCGAPSPHGLGHKQGGLEAQESELGKERQQIELLKEQLKNVVADNTCLSPTGGAAQVLNKVGTLARAHETHTLQVAKRRMYSLSQALSTTVNGILMKLALLAEGHITIETAEAWKEHGILVLFEGLLSITGNERSMIEDTMVAVDSLRLFSIRLVECDDSPVVVNPSDEAPHTVSSTHRGRSGSAPVVHKQEFSKPSKSGSLSGVSSGHIRAAPSSIIAPGTANTTYSPIGHASYLESSYKMGMHVTLSGREVTVHVPKSAMAKLPQCISGSGEEGTVLRIVSVLVNQVGL